MFVTYPTFTVAIDDCFDTLIDLLPCPLSTPLNYDSTEHFAGCTGPLQLKVLRMAHKARRVTTHTKANNTMLCPSWIHPTPTTSIPTVDPLHVPISWPLPSPGPSNAHSRVPPPSPSVAPGMPLNVRVDNIYEQGNLTRNSNGN